MRWLLTLVILVAGACRGPERAARADLLAEHPTAQIVDLFVGEGDADHAYVHACFTLPPDSVRHSEVWLYQQLNGHWRRSPVTVPNAPADRARCIDEA